MSTVSRRRSSFLAILVAAGLPACGKDERKRDQEGGSGDIAIVLRSTKLSLASSSAASLMGACQVTAGTSQTNGSCYTPSAVRGAFNTARLRSTEMGGAPVRILGGGTASGPADIFKHASFDLKQSPSIKGEDNIENATSTSFNFMTLQAQYLEFGFVGTPDNKEFRVRTFFVNNVPSTESALSASSCRVSSALSEADAIGTLFPGSAAQAGDILVCVKPSSASTCTDVDFQWVTSEGTLTTARPTSPKRQSGSSIINATACPSDGANWGYGSLDLGFSSPVTASARFDEGKKIYTVGSSSGSKLTFTVDINLDGALFVPQSTGISDLAAATENAVLANIDQILLKSMFIAKASGRAADNVASMLTATPSLTVE